MRVLILGGTQEAYELAERLAEIERLEIISSLAGRTREPRQPQGAMRSGGFGGPEGLARYLRDERIRFVVNATHPFADQISAHAVEAAAASGTELLRLLRPAWRAAPEDRWIAARDAAEAAELARREGGRILLTVGSGELDAFAPVRNAHFVVRMVDVPERIPLHDYRIIAARGPFELADELRLLAEHHINLVVAKNSGGGATFAKLEAARRLRLPVIMIERPPIAQEPRSPVATSVDEVIAALRALLA
ncbi:MAG TPA: cobalt-precorrin-6A reductase [Alphaproteobacteria bacterium]|nr:cobalt-precorrin-6A reductase [Alphaproteobacteria bacterium]